MSELEKEAEEYLESKLCENVCYCNEIEECKKNIRIRCMSFNHKKELITSFAKSKEKRIAELEKENAELKKEVEKHKWNNIFLEENTYYDKKNSRRIHALTRTDCKT